MTISEGEFTLDRRALVQHAKDLIQTIVSLNAVEDIECGSEFILTAQDLLEFAVVIPSHLMNEKVPAEYSHVHHSIIKITYKQDKNGD